MIFSKFFKKKNHLSEKVSDRIVAVAELDPKVSENKSILHELAFNDGDDKVRRAALEKLNDFSLFWQAFKKDSSDTIKKLSEKAIIDNLIGVKDSNIDAKLKRQFIQECNKAQLLEKVVFKLDDEALIEQTLIKLNKPSLLLQSLQVEHLPHTLKSTLLSHIDDVSQLKKLTKKLTGELLTEVETKLADIKEQQDKPVKLEKQLRLLLAQFNALKDKSDVEAVEAKIADIESEWQQCDLAILPAVVKDELTQKYDAIAASVQRILAPKKEQWLQQKAEQELASKQQQNYQTLTQELTVIEAKITQSIVDGAEITQEQLTQDINQLEKQVNELEVTKEHKATVLSRAESLFNRANQLPVIKQGIEQAKQLLEQLTALVKPQDLDSLNQVNQEFKAIKSAWQQNLAQVDIAMPESISQAYEALLEQWQPAISELEKEQRQLFSQTRRKMSELENLIKQGKFHSAFGLFKKLGYWMADLNDYQKNQLDRKWQALQLQVEELHDLEKSFSNPKKQELLEQIKKLAESPLVDPTEQAHRVRLLRSNWQSLGHADDEQEQALNQEFDQYCETAFAPCREHYKELEDERQSNYDGKVIVIEQLEALAKNLASAEVKDWRSVESLFVKLNKLWRETGLVDREKVAEVNKRFHSAVKPIKQAIAQYHTGNETQKRGLIEQASQVANSDISISEKSESLKQLQNKWRDIGFAGNKVDQKLWTEFRAVNNPVFEQRDNTKKAEQAEAKQLFNDYNERLKQVVEQVSATSELAKLKELAQQAEQIFSQVSGLARNDYEKLKKLSQSIKSDVENKIAEARKQKESQSFIDLFDAVTAIANGESADLSVLKPAWQTAINSNNKEQRSLLTLQIEISANLSSPESEQAQRNQVQMSMLSAKLEQGEAFGLQDLLEKWLAAGIFEQQDLVMLERIKPAYLSA